MAAVIQERQLGSGGLAYADAIDEACKSNQFQPAHDDDFCAVQAKVFKRRRRANAVLAGDPKSALASKCCDRCKSDLNGKLMVRCASCPFRCHLYCFSPPLKQHPGFLIRQQQKNLKDDVNNSPSNWKCEKCQGTSVVFNADLKSSIPKTKSPSKAAIRSPVKRDKVVSNSAVGASTLQVKSSVQETMPSWDPVQSQWIANKEVTFDWYRFRAEKVEVLRQHETRDVRNGLDELVFYSKSYALMKKTAAIWRAHTLKRRQFRHRQEREARALQYPEFRSGVMSTPLPIDGAVRNVVSGVEDEDGDDIYLDHFSNKPYSQRPPRLPLLWKGDPPSAFVCWSTAEHQKIEEIVREIQERLCLASEDIDAVAVEHGIDVVTMENDIYADIEQAIEYDSDDDGSDTDDRLDIHMASKIIQRIFIRHHRWRRRTDRANRQRRALGESKRRAKARSSIFVLRTCIQFIIQLMKLLGQAQTKKSMLLVLQDAAEETQVKNMLLSEENMTSNETTKQASHGRKQQLAEIRIRRFFVRRVHPYMKIKKHVMARRIQRWWKHKFLPHKWREIAGVVRRAHREQASVRIQRLYRRFRTQRKFKVLIEKNTLNILRRQIRRWVFARLAKKEAIRLTADSATLEATGDLQPQTEPLDEFLESRGMAFYHEGDFWNAASMLERLWELKKGTFTQELQQVLAYSHHMTWYESYDQFNLIRAHELYRTSLEVSATRKQAVRPDPSVLQDFAIVLMQLEHFGDSLRLFAKLIEFFAREPQFPLWLLLAAVQLQQHGEWEQSVRYLSYLHDIPPSPYLERDILALCAMGYERLALKATPEQSSSATFAKEAWRSALRQWNHEEIISGSTGSALNTCRGNGRAFLSRQKWYLLTNLAKRALGQGHFLLSCRVYIYALERQDEASIDTSAPSQLAKEEFRTAWWNLADAFRHLGHIDLYLNVMQRSRSSMKQDRTETDDELLIAWQKQAELQACSFQRELKALTVNENLQKISKHTKMQQV